MYCDAAAGCCGWIGPRNSRRVGEVETHEWPMKVWNFLMIQNLNMYLWALVENIVMNIEFMWLAECFMLFHT